MCATIRVSIGALAILAQLSFGAGVVVARERLLRCVPQTAIARPGQKVQQFSPHHFYAPVSSAMFFSHAGSACRWKAPRHLRG